MKLSDFNREELVIGASTSLVFFYWLGGLSLLLAPITAFFWALSGSKLKSNSKLWRRLGVPLVVATGLYLTTRNWHVFLAILTGFGALSLGYGLPDIQGDEGSWLARFWIKVGVSGDQMLDLFVRGTIYLLFIVPFLIAIYWRA